MITQAWIDPRTIDWRDGLNPLARPAWRADANPYVHESLNDPLMLALRHASAEMAVHPVPDEANSNIPGLATFDQIIGLEANSWLIGFSATSQQALGFTVQITAQGIPIFSKPVHHTALQGTPVFFCPIPRALIVPELAVRLVNLSAIANNLQVCIWTIHEVAP
jgi:hypothetical protein